jgi:phosphomevalonate kinase
VSVHGAHPVIVARAPGKVFLTGEYAVLVGAPALVAAVDRVAEVRIAPQGRPGPLVIASLAENERRVVDGEDRGELPGGDAGAVLAAHRAVSARVPLVDGLDITVDSRPFLAGSRKLGLGRSAATLVATVAGLLAVDGRRESAEPLDLALLALAHFQGGEGSGADIAAAVRGGVVEVVRRDARLAVMPRALPTGLELLVGWTGEAAATVPLLRRFSAATRTKPAVLRELGLAAERAAAAVRAADRPAFLEAVDRSGSLLELLGREIGLPITTPALARLVAAARRAGAMAKPSGAGGGDCGISFATSPAQAAAVREAWEAEGIVPLPLAVESAGVRSWIDAQATEGASIG